MAAHITCQNSEILPNTFPSPRPKSRDHGMISEYETPFVMQRKKVYATEVSGGHGIETEDYPILKKPIPISSHHYNLSLDPALCVTPEKTKRNLTTLQRLKGDITDKSPPSERGSKVRFDKTVEVKELTPETSDVTRKTPSDLGTSFQTIDSNQPTSGPTYLNSKDAWYGKTSEPNLRNKPGRGDNIYASDTVFDCDPGTPISVLASDLVSVPEPAISPVVLVDKVNTQSSDDSESADELRQIMGYEEHVLARPEFNSTLRKSKEMKQLQDSEIDLCAAVEQKLKTSERTKGMLLEKANSKVNAKWESQQYSDLVSVEVSELDTVVINERPTKAPRLPQKTSPANGAQIQEPDILDFFSPDLQKEAADYNLAGLPSLDIGPQTADATRAFDVYKHLRVWEKW